LIEAWQKICVLGERLVRKREAAAVRSTSTRPSFMPHLHLPPVLRISSPLSVSTTTDAAAAAPLGLTAAFSSSSRDPALSLSPLSTAQADLSRLTNTLKMLVEVNGQCWKGQDCDLSDGVRQGISVVSAHTQRHADLLEIRVCVFFFGPRSLVRHVPGPDKDLRRLDGRVAAGDIGRSEGSPQSNPSVTLLPLKLLAYLPCLAPLLISLASPRISIEPT
jgi:hypothetical protein